MPRNTSEGISMHSRFTPGQRTSLESALVQRQHALDQRLSDHTDGHTRAEHARDLLTQDSDDLTQHQDERDQELSRADADVQDLGDVSQALGRLRRDEFGACADCGQDIPFDRLVVQPWAVRCVACQAADEAHPGSRSRSPTTTEGETR